MDMLKQAAIFAAILAFSPFLPTQAQQADGDAVTAAAVDIEDCKRLLARNAAKSANYQPGVDVRGKKVAPADLPNEGAVQLPREIVIDFGLDLAEKYGFDNGGLHTGTADIGTIVFDTVSGGLTFNGKPLMKDDQRAILNACALAMEGQGQ